MSTSYFKNPSNMQNKITQEDIKRLEKVFELISKDPQASEFLEPVDYVALNIPDYPMIIKNPMDLGTVKKKLLEKQYETFEQFFSDINLIWTNCRTYNLQGSEIVKMANHCDKTFKKIFEKIFKNYESTINKKDINNNTTNNNSNNKGDNKNKTLLSFNEKRRFIEKIRNLGNDGVSEVVRILQKECSKCLEDLDQEKLQINVDIIDKKNYEFIMSTIESQLIGKESNQ